jgi:hypothetical protein
VIGFVTFFVVAFIPRVGMIADPRVVWPSLIACPLAIASLVVARARRNGKRNSE